MMHIIRQTILLFFFLLCQLDLLQAQQGFGAPVYWQHFGVSPKGDPVAGPALPPGRTGLSYSSVFCPPPGAYSILKRVPLGSCYTNEWIPLSNDFNSTYDASHAEGNMMLVNNTVYTGSRKLYMDTVYQPLCTGIDYYFSAAIINLDLPLSCPGSHFFPRLAFSLETISGQVLVTDTIRSGIAFANPFMGYKFGEFGVWLTMPAMTGPLVLRIDLLTTYYDCAEDFAIDDIRLRPRGAEVKIQFPGEPGHTVKAACYQQQPTVTIHGNPEPYYSNPALQWQVSTDSGATWADVPGQTGTVLTQTYTVPDTFYYRLSAAELSMIANPACRVVSNKLRVEIQGPPAGYTISSNSPVCSGQPLLFKAEGAASYEWSGPNGFYDNVPTPSIYFSTLADSGQYYITVSSWGGCTVTDSVRVKILGTDVHAWPDTAICIGNRITLRASTGVHYEWTGEGISGNHTVQFPKVNAVKSGRYTVKVTDVSGCSDTASLLIQVRNKIPLKAIMDFPPFLCRSMDSLLFKSKSTGVIDNWYWDFGNSQVSRLEAPPVQYYLIPGARVQYNAWLAVSDTAGCTDTAYQQIQVENNCFIAVPSGFTPNNDGRNDYLYPLNVFKVTNLHFQVFNRNGRLVFESRDGNRKWDGRVGAVLQDTGVYIWVLSYTDEAGRKVFQKGTTLLIR